MHIFTFADKDATLYEASSSLNSGLDEILEVRKDVSDTGDVVDVSRILIQFDLTKISQSIYEGAITNPKFFLNLFDARPTALATSQSLHAYPVTGSWLMGEGRSYDNPINEEGCSWDFRDGATNGTLWNQLSGSGGNWISGSGYVASSSLNHKSQDVRMDVTQIVNKWLDGTTPNEGFIIKRSGSLANVNTGSDEGNTTRFGNLSFFSSDTHTKYPPTLETVWNDAKWTTGSLQPITGSDLEDSLIYMKGLKEEYKENSRVRFRLVCRERFPATTYSTTPSNLVVKYLPTGSSFYSIKDAETHDVIVPYGSSSLISCDSNGNYFNLWLDGYQPERYYTLEYRVQSGSGTADEIDQYFVEGFTFKVSI